jgi:hypothetical protein
VARAGRIIIAVVIIITTNRGFEACVEALGDNRRCIDQCAL